jgi:hypothetical protein
MPQAVAVAEKENFSAEDAEYAENTDLMMTEPVEPAEPIPVEVVEPRDPAEPENHE